MIVDDGDGPAYQAIRRKPHHHHRHNSIDGMYNTSHPVTSTTTVTSSNTSNNNALNSARSTGMNDSMNFDHQPIITEERLHFDYKVIDVIGQGDFGTVWKVRHCLDGKVYAVKQFNKKFRGEIDRQRKLQEVYAQSSCTQCPHVVKYYESWTDNQTLFVRMEFCDGGSVREAMPIGEYCWSETELWDLCYQIALALHALHSRNIAHLDVKFENVYIKNVKGRKVFKLGDFGLVRSTAEDVDTWVGFNDDEGDKRYLCPVLLAENTNCKEADVFALGLNLYEAVTGVPVPMEGPAYQKLRSGYLPGLDHLSAELRTLMEGMLCPQPMGRPSAFQVVRTCAEQIQYRCAGGGAGGHAACGEWFRAMDEQINVFNRTWST